VDVDVIQAFQFGGIGALMSFDIDILVTPDPVHKPGLRFIPVFDYEQVLVVSTEHPLAEKHWVEPSDLSRETLITYPVERSRLDIFSLFLHPAGILPAQHKTLETTDMMLQMIAAGRGAGALPAWLVNEYAELSAIKAVRLTEKGLHKKLHLGVRDKGYQPEYLTAFIELAKTFQNSLPAAPLPSNL